MINIAGSFQSPAVTGLVVMQQHSKKDQRIHTVLSTSTAEIVPMSLFQNS